MNTGPDGSTLRALIRTTSGIGEGRQTSAWTPFAGLHRTVRARSDASDGPQPTVASRPTRTAAVTGGSGSTRRTTAPDPAVPDRSIPPISPHEDPGAGVGLR